MTRCFIVASGDLPEPHTLTANLRPTDLLIAADGGANHLHALGLIPHLLIGDLDSATPPMVADLQAQGVPVEQHPPAKDVTDLELALLTAQRLGAHEVILLGVLGNRWDHSLANLLLLANPLFADLHMAVWHGHERLYVVRGMPARPGVLTLAGAPGDTLSLIPLQGDVRGVTLAGLAYPLRHDTLRFGATRGLSNVFDASTAFIEIHDGLALVIHTQHSQIATGD